MAFHKEVYQGLLCELYSVIYVYQWIARFMWMDFAIYLFADNAKVFKHIIDKVDNKRLESSIDALKEWSDHWVLKLN